MLSVYAGQLVRSKVGTYPLYRGEVYKVKSGDSVYIKLYETGDAIWHVKHFVPVSSALFCTANMLFDSWLNDSRKPRDLEAA